MLNPRLRLLWAAVTASIAAAAFASANAATLTGLVATTAGQPVAGALVTLWNEPRNRKETVYTNAEGRYVLDTGFSGKVRLRGRAHTYRDFNVEFDLDAALRIALEFPEPVGVVIKHTNPCGVALGATIADAYVRAREADPLSAFGGIVGLNRTLDAETARALTSTFIEAVIAPAVADEARPILATKANLRVATVDFVRLGALDADQSRDTRTFLGGIL